MPEYEFSLTRIFPYKDRIYDPVLKQEIMDHRKLFLWHILRSVIDKKNSQSFL